MLRHILNGVCLIPKGRRIVAGAIGMLAGIEHLLATRPKAHAGRPVHQDAPVALPEPVMVRTRERLFAIRRTKSELGYTYWVLQGFDACKCFLLFDTWQEAMDEANVRLHSSQPVEALSFAAASGKAY